MIYENYFSLQQRPFSIAPNPQFLYAHGQYQEAMAVLEYGLFHRGGFILLTGEVGTGKTTLCKHLLESIPQGTEVALILHPQLDRLELLQLVCREFNIQVNRGAKESELIELLTEFLLSVYSKGGHSLLVIDEAQHLSVEVLELIRLLTNLETHRDKLLQIILLGQPELNQRLEQYELRQLNQRFTARFHLKPLTFNQLRLYVKHRLKVAGSRASLFSIPALFALKRMSQGIPRLINLLADRSLMGGYVENQSKVSAWVVYKAAKEVLPQKKGNKFKYAFVVLLVLNLSFYFVAKKDVFELPSVDVVRGQFDAYQSKNAVSACLSVENCWQGLLPQNLIPFSRSDVKVYDQGGWVTWSEPLNNKSLLLAQINWESPFYFDGLIKAGSQHEAVPWVRSILESNSSIYAANQNVDQWQVIRPENSKPESKLYYDVLLLEKVKSFQRDQQLLVDGILGKQTLISLSLYQQKISGNQ